MLGDSYSMGKTMIIIIVYIRWRKTKTRFEYWWGKRHHNKVGMNWNVWRSAAQYWWIGEQAKGLTFRGGEGGEAPERREDQIGMEQLHFYDNIHPSCTPLNTNIKKQFKIMFTLSILFWMRSRRVVRTSDCNCQSRNSSGFDPRILLHSGSWGAADDASKKISPFVKCLHYKKSLLTNFASNILYEVFKYA